MLSSAFPPTIWRSFRNWNKLSALSATIQPKESCITKQYTRSSNHHNTPSPGSIQWLKKCRTVKNRSLLVQHFSYSSLVPNRPQHISFSTSQRIFNLPKSEPSDQSKEADQEWKENVWTVPNALTISRIALTPVLGYMVLEHHYMLACGMFLYAGVTDLLDGYIARRYPSQASMFGSYLDPLADKFLVSVLYLSLTIVGLIPVPLTTLVIARDVSLITAAFYVRYISLAPPRTLSRYFDVTHATAELHPTLISKVNTAVQLSLVAASLAAPVLGYVDHVLLQALWYLTAGTTFASGVTYMFAKDTFKVFETAQQSKRSRKKKEQQGQ